MTTEATKSRATESVTARALLESDRPSRADVMCHGQRHKLARVYDLGPGGLVLATPRRTLLRSFLYADTPEDDTSEVVIVPWLYRLDGTDPEERLSIVLRCRCHTYSTKLDQLRDQLERLPVGDRYLMVGIAKRNRHAERGTKQR